MNTIPTAATTPKSRIGGSADVRFAPKPMTVVPMTMKNATSSWSVVTRIAGPISSPVVRSSRYRLTAWMPKSMPTASNSGGMVMRIWLNGMPARPMNPNVQMSPIASATTPSSRSARSR